MLKLSEDNIISKIEKKETFCAITEDRAFTITIEKYVPYVCGAIHNGGNFMHSLLPKINLSRNERWYEEDPYTGMLIDNFPIQIISYDSRYLYDINRKPEECIYETAWGRNVWKEKLSESERGLLLERHARFYRVIHALIQKLNEIYSGSVVYDIHSYNYQREGQKPDLPLFNIGTERITNPSFENFILSWMQELGEINLPDIVNRVARNEVFYGRGYFLEYLVSHFPNTLVLATEIKKVYCNENTGDEYPEIISSLKSGLNSAITKHSKQFMQYLKV